MRIGDVLYFSPRFSFTKLNLDDPATLIDALQDRVDAYYLQPAFRCLASGDAFAGGLVCCAAIDFLALVCEEKPPSDWLNTHIPAFSKHDGIAEQFWIRFRHGLMHEGYIKSQGQFSLQSPELLLADGPAIVINPQLLLETVDRAFREYCKMFNPGQAPPLAKRLHRYFDAEIKAALRPDYRSQEQQDDQK
jgi:hypothetical protein